MSENYEKVKLLGEGAFGKAFLAKCFATRSHVVLKEINLAKMTLKERREARREVLILSQLEHCCIVSYINSYETPKCLVIVMEYCDNGDLQHKLMSRKNNFLSEDQILSWFVQICLALKHLHDRKILHRDIKSQNIFLTKSGLVKLGDFGIAKILNNTTELALTQAGTPYYLSPEICDARPYNNKSDIWSMGCILYELSSLKHPFSGKTIMDLVRNIKKASYIPIPSCFSADLHELVSKLLKKHPQDRPDINSILKHPIVWIKIGEYLTQKDYEKEFSHTVLHGLKMSKPSQPVDPKKHKKVGKTQETPKSEINNKKDDESNRVVRKNVGEHKSARDPCFQIKPKCYDEKVKAKNLLKPEIKKHQVNVEIQKTPKEPLQKANDFLRRRNEYAERLRQIRLQNLKKKFNPKDGKAKAPSKENRNQKYAYHRNRKDFDESYQRAIKEVEALGRMSSSKKTKKKASTKKTNQSSDSTVRGRPQAPLNERRNSARSSLDNVRVASARVGSSKRKSLPNIKDTPRSKETARKQWNIPKGSKVSKLVAVETEHVQGESKFAVKKDEVTSHYEEEVKKLLTTGKLDIVDPLLLRTCSEPDLLNIRGLQSDEEDDSTVYENKNKLVSHKEDGFEMILPLLKSKSMSDLTSSNLKNSSGKALSNSSESSCSESNDELDSVRESMVSCLTFTPLLEFERELENIQEIPEGCKERAIKCAWEGTEFGLQKLQSTILKTIKYFTEEGFI